MRRLVLGVCVFAFGYVSATGGAAAQAVQAGTLVCDVSAGIGMIIASEKSVQCSFTPAPMMPPQPAEFYVGNIKKLGIDIGATSSGQMVWAVFAPAARINPGGLSGVYGGATAEATVSVGLGANVLVGGSNRAVALQPVSVTGQTGLNVAAGVASLELQLAQ